MTAPAIREKSSAPRTSGRTVYLRFAPVERGPGPGPPPPRDSQGEAGWTGRGPVDLAGQTTA